MSVTFRICQYTIHIPQYRFQLGRHFIQLGGFLMPSGIGTRPTILISICERRRFMITATSILDGIWSERMD